jgi:hypothetical protein
MGLKTVDLNLPICYNTCMEIKKPLRKRRQDSNHAVYTITNLVTGDYYIGITVCSGSVKRALKVRFQKHVRRAVTEGKMWALCNSIREFGPETHTVEFVEKIRGRKPAHARERELIRAYTPALNTH